MATEIMGPANQRTEVQFRVFLNGQAPEGARA